MLRTTFLAHLFISLTVVWSQKVPIPDEERTGAFWEKMGQKNLQFSLRLSKIESVAKNVIFFLGDGMGLSTITATRILKGQRNNKVGEEELLAFDEFPFVSLSKTYGIDRYTSDSANTATASLCGVKANYGTLGVDGRAVFGNCSSVQDPSTHVNSILQWAQEAGKWTGFITTTRVTHATPAALYAHTPNRDWESESPSIECKDIAKQLVQDIPGKNIRVIMGGGTKYFLPESQKDKHGQPGARKDSKNLLDQWLNDKKSMNERARILFDAEELYTLNPDEVDYLMGLFSDDHLPYITDRTPDKIYPSLTEMTDKAIKLLSRNPKGFFLMVEGGRIDLAHHNNWAQRALVESIDFDKAVGTAVKATNIEDTLIVVTADHSFAFTLGGNYPMRGSNILGIGGVSDIDNNTYTSLGYYNGPGFRPNARKHNLTENEVLDKDYQSETALPVSFGNHGGEDVPVYARGPMAHLFHGVHDQSYIPYVMGYASCVGPKRDHCSSAWSPLMGSHWITFLKFTTIAVWTYSAQSLM